jgi:hypothetical protein
MNANDIVFTHVGPDGIVNITAANLMSDHFRALAVAFIKLDPAAYETYKSIKRPGGVATLETRKAAYQWALGKASEMALAGYLRVRP